MPYAAELIKHIRGRIYETAYLAASLPFDFIHFGNFTRMVESGQSDGQVLLADLPQRKGDWGLGATAGLKGEIVQIDGQLLISRGSDAQGRVQAPQRGEEAVLFVGARVAAWAEVSVPSDMSQARLESLDQTADYKDFPQSQAGCLDVGCSPLISGCLVLALD